MQRMLLSWLITLLLVLSVRGYASEPTQKGPSAGPVGRAPLPPGVVWTTGVARESYEALVARIRARDSVVDFRETRAAYAELPVDQRGCSRKLPKKEMLEALNQKMFDDAAKHAQTILSSCYVDIDTHVLASIAYRQSMDLERANFHRWVADGLIQSILDSGDGKSPETALEVISVSEEYALFRVLGLRVKSQALMERHGHHYDVMQVVDSRTGKELTLHFNVDTSMREIGQVLRPAPK
jgi:hypothetical protein